MNKNIDGVEKFEPRTSSFIDRSTIVYGESGTGKSTIITDILYYLSSGCEQIIVISPTDRQNKTYSAGLVPPPLIHYTFNEELLSNIWERQVAMSTIYTQANRPEILRSLFMRLHDRTETGKIELEVQSKIAEIRATLNSPDCSESDRCKYSAAESELTKLLPAMYKEKIAQGQKRGDFSRLNLSPEEKLSLRWLCFNPRLVLVFDDCTDLLKKYRGSETIQKIFYQGRWSYITVIIACHTDKVIEPEIKKNAFLSIFTQESCARSYFDRASLALDREGKARAAEACKIAFSPLRKHQKLVYNRLENKFYTWTASPRSDFCFCSGSMRQYCEGIVAAPGSEITNNRFINQFSMQ